MAQQMSDYFAKALMDFYIGKNNTTLTVPATLYVAMFVATPGVGGSGSSGTELAIANYLRLAITNNTTNFAAATGSGTRIKAGQWGTPLTWFTAGATSAAIVATALLDASTVGTGNIWLLNEIALGSQQVITSGNNITFNATDFSWSIT
jgi:hypothetical protein